MIDIGFSMIPFWDPKGERGGYKLAVMYDSVQKRHDVIGPTNRRYWLKDSKNHMVLFRQDVLGWLEDQAGPSRTPETRRVVCWDCTLLVQLIIQPMLLAGYTQTEQWTPRKQEFFLLDDGEVVHTLVFRSRKTGTEIRIISLKQFVRGHNGFEDIYSKIKPDEVPIGQIPVETWGEPTAGGLRQIFDHARALTDVWQRCFDSGYIWETSGRAISAGGIAWMNFKRELWARAAAKPTDVFYPGMGPDLIRAARDIMEDELRDGCRGGISYARIGEYHGVYGYDLNGAYGAALDDWIPYGPLMSIPPKDDPCRGIVYPQGYFLLKRDMLPILSWSTSYDCARYAWEREYKPHEKVYEFFLDGSIPFYQEEWELMLEFYEPAGAYEIPKVWYISIMHFGLLGQRMERLYQMELMYPNDKLFNKMQIVQLYGKLSQHDETDNVYYLMEKQDNGILWPRRYCKTVGISSQHLGLGMWVTAYCRCRIMRKLLDLKQAGVSLDEVVYIDTDAIYLSGKHDELFDLKRELGCWKQEASDQDMSIVQPKAYQIRMSSKVKTVCSSLPAAITRTLAYGDLTAGTSYEYYEYVRDPLLWSKQPHPHRFAVSSRSLDTSDQAYVVPEEIDKINGEYEL